MKYLLSILIFSSGFLYAQHTAIDSIHKHKGPLLKFVNDNYYDFGKIPKDTEVQHTFTFINAGDEPLVITDVLNSCACGTAEWSKQPIPPGKKGIVREYLKTNNLDGDFVKDCYVKSNAENSMYGGVGYQLSIHGRVQSIKSKPQ